MPAKWSQYWPYDNKQDEQLRAIARALRNVRPGIESRLDFPFMDYLDFKAIVDTMYANINARRTHALEGWDGQGFMMPEYWNAAAAAWVPVESVRQEPSVIQQAIYNAIQPAKWSQYWPYDNV